MDRVLETVELGLEGQVQARADLRRIARADLRHPFVGRDDQAVGVLQHLPALRACIGRPVARRTGELQVGGEQAWCQALHAAREVLPVVVVRNALRRQRQAGVAPQARFVREAERITRPAGEAVVRQQAEPGHAVECRLEVAELAVGADTALDADHRRDGRVAVRCDVPVVRLRDLQTALAVHADAGRQPARFALVGERKAQHRRGQDRHAVEAQHGLLGDAFVGIEVQAHLAGAEQPGRPARPVGRATAVGRGRRHRALAVDEVDALGMPARTGAGEEVVRAQEVALETLHLELHLRAAEQVAIAVHADVATRQGQVFGLVIAQQVGADRHAAALEFDIAFGHRLQIGAASQLTRLQDDGRHLGGRGRRGGRRCSRCRGGRLRPHPRADEHGHHQQHRCGERAVGVRAKELGAPQNVSWCACARQGGL